MELARLIAEMCHPAAYPEPTALVDVRQTHISVVFLTDRFAYKIKKPVTLEYLDYSTLEKRRHWCEEEVRLNRRLAPHVYLGVAPIAQDGQSIRVEGPGPIIEWAVKMRRLPEEASLAAAVARNDVSHEAVAVLARRVADFHHHAERSESVARFGRFDVVASNARDNFTQSTSLVGTTVSRNVFERLEALTEKSLGRLQAIIEDRAAQGVPCDAHGDLRTDHIYLFPDRVPPDDFVIVDCIEFNLRFRASDPVCDMAFLTMDLVRRGRRDLARTFAHAYFAAADDVDGMALVPFYISYRAAVRAKVSGLKTGEAEVPFEQRSAARTEARAHWLAALGALEEPGRRPCLVLIGGLPGTGKSTLAQALASHAGFDVIRSDQIRKQLAVAGVVADADASDAYAAGIYTPEWTERTYAECIARADAALFEGSRVLVDATFRAESHRLRFLDLAATWGVPLILWICQADAAIVKGRLQERRDDVSDADWTIYLHAARRWEPLGPRTQQLYHTIDTGRSGPEPFCDALGVLREHELWD
jgi:aminoglycoside phosphotransferase family enzyme/predicted kinase